MGDEVFEAFMNLFKGKRLKIYDWKIGGEIQEGEISVAERGGGIISVVGMETLHFQLRNSEGERMNKSVVVFDIEKDDILKFVNKVVMGLL